jgi:hypothetical protein
MSAEMILAVIFGWLLGLFSPAISKRIHGASKKNDLRQAILAELDELGYKMALVSHAVRSHLDQLSDDHVLWLEAKMARYEGPENAAGVLLLLAELKKHPASVRSRSENPYEERMSSVGLLEHSLPLLNLHRHEMADFPLAFQSAVLQIVSQLQIFNQRVVMARQQLERALQREHGSRPANGSGELGESYQELASRSRLIADLVDNVPR